MVSKEQLYLSASRIKTYLTCQWSYYCSYILKLPDPGNFGSKRGNVCHDVFERLLDPKYRSWYDYIIKNKTCRGRKQIENFIEKCIQKYGIEEEYDNKGVNNRDLIDEMIYNGCAYDFFCNGWELQEPEEYFEYINKSPYYAIRGYIDKNARRNRESLIRDYKSSARIDEDEHELQGMIYSLYKLKVQQLKAFVEFQFLRFPESPVVRFKFDEDELLGIEDWLEELQNNLENFDYSDAWGHFAKDDGYPTINFICGYAQYPGHSYAEDHRDKDKAGRPYHCCPHKFTFDYYALVKNGEIESTAFKKEDLEKKKGFRIVQMKYEGCPRWDQPENT